MGNLPLIFLPPQNWQDFEKLIKGIVDVIWPQESWQFYGRPGQKQSGIDIWGYDEKGRATGIQCKQGKIVSPHGDLRKDSFLTEETIRKEIASAENISDPALERLIFATTASNDVNIQKVTRNISQQRKKANRFPVDIWFWEDIQVFLERHIELQLWYYADYLEKIHQYDKNAHMLTALRRAFMRPAFHRKMLLEESGRDFIQAIKDTQELITTGKLYNRRGDLLATTFDYTVLNKEEWKAKVWSIYQLLNNIRDEYQNGLRLGDIQESEFMLLIADRQIAELFDNLRSDCLIIMNQILHEASLAPITSGLLSQKA